MNEEIVDMENAQVFDYTNPAAVVDNILQQVDQLVNGQTVKDILYLRLSLKYGASRGVL